MALVVKKFGGSSLANVEKVRNAASIIAREYQKDNQVVVVVSAQGDTTDELLQKAASITQKASKREMDVLISTGEQMSMALLAMMLQTMSVPAVSLCGWQAGVLTDHTYGSARIRQVKTERIRRELAQGNVVVVAGFQGVNGCGDITTIGRGGSDTTAVALAAMLKADVCRIYTDVDGIYSADPRVVKSAVKHREIGYDEMLELASLGAQVLHNRSVEMAKRYGVELEVLSSFEEKPGTKVREVLMEQRTVSGVARDNNVALITVRGLPQECGTAYHLFARLAEKKVVVDMILQPADEKGTHSMCFSVPQTMLAATVEALCGCQQEIGFDDFAIDENVCKLSIVGMGMANNAGIAACMFEALYREKIAIRCITTSEVKISVLIDCKDSDRAFNAVHDAFF